jgi:uroporphyrinogen-III synthase
MHLIVTRPAAQAAGWVDALRAMGCDAQALPLIDIAALADTAPLREAWQGLPRYTLVMFVSANAVQHFFAAAPSSATDAWPVGVRAAATGPGTASALRAAGVPDGALVEPAADATRFDSETLWAQVAHEDWADRHVLVVRGEEGRDWLADTLRARGAKVDFVAAYRRLAPQPDAAGRALLAAAAAEPAAHLWLFSSSEAVAHLQALTPGADWSRSAALATHPRIAAAARSAGFGRVALTAPATEAVARAAARGFADGFADGGVGAPAAGREGRPEDGPSIQSGAL